MNGTGAAKLGLVYGAGGTRGGAFIRAGIAALAERTGWVPAMSTTIIGTSVGALNAARVDPQPIMAPVAVADALGDLAARLTPCGPGLFERVIPVPRRLGGRIAGRIVPAGAHAPEYGVATPPYHPGVRVVSCRRSNGSRRITKLDEAFDPANELYASAAIPGFSRPVQLDGADHVDGAIWSTTNADLISTRDHDLLIVIAPMVPTEGGSTFQRTNRALLLDELGPWRRAGRPVLFLGPSPTAMAAPDDIEAFAADARSQILG